MVESLPCTQAGRGTIVTDEVASKLIERFAAFIRAVSEAYERKTGTRPEVYEFSAVAGARVASC